MAKEYFEVDENGSILDVHLLAEEDEVPANHFLGWGERIFYKPKWDFTTSDWVEGATPEELIALKNPPPSPPTETERIDALEFMLMDIMMKQQMQEMMDMQPPDLKL